MFFDQVQPLTLSDFDYELPEELIAQYPAEKRDGSRLLVLNKKTGAVAHQHFPNVADYLNSGDVLIVNETKVFPARLFAMKDKTDTSVEVFMLRELGKELWEVLVKPARKVRVGNKLVIDGKYTCDVIDNTVSGGRVIRFESNGETVYEMLDQVGKWPLPPYIKRQAEALDKERYQTVYAHDYGAVAAPTAGLHFTDEILAELRAKGVVVKSVLLHVGLGTFRPVSVEDLGRHHMDSEEFIVPEDTVEAIKTAKASGNRVVAVGTTVVRALESAVVTPNGLKPMRGWTDKFIKPPFEFKVIDSLITNFHQPKSTLLMLVSALSTRDMIIKAYAAAIAENYRFFSYGDAMFIR